MRAPPAAAQAIDPDAAQADAQAQIRPGRCILVENTLANLKGAKKLGLRTAWVTQYLKMADPIGMARLPKALNRPAYVDVKVKSVRHLARRLHRLR